MCIRDSAQAVDGNLRIKGCQRLAQHKPGVALLREEIAPETAARDLAVMRAWAGR